MDGEMDRLIARAKKRDAEAFTQLMDQQAQGFYKVARAILENDEDAADAIQDTLLACWEKLGTLRENRYFKTWATKILINNCYGLIRQRRGVSLVEEVPDAVPWEDHSEVEWKEALGLLEEKYRIVVVLYYAQGFRTKEIAALLDLSDATVRTRLARAREQLKKYYGEA